MKKIMFSLVVILCVMTGCKEQIADTVVYGSIHTADIETPVAEAIAIKDGKYIYVGDKDGAAAFIKEGVTQIIDHTGKGMVMPGCTEGHAHYLMGSALVCLGGLTISNESDGIDSFFEKVKTAYEEAKSEGKRGIFGMGWNYHTFTAEGMPTRDQLDAICPDIPLYVYDSEGHKALVNTACLRNAGVMDESGNVLKSQIRGGEICMDKNGKPNGLLLEQAATYVRNKGVDFNDLFSLEPATKALEMSCQMLWANGYTTYMDGWSNYFGNSSIYEAAAKLDQEGKLNLLLGLSYEIESSCEDVDAEIAKAVEMKKYSNEHIFANYIKLFIDGTVEGGTGLTLEPYPDGHPGIANWEEDEVADITGKANAQGLTMHIHTMGDGAVHRCVNAFVNKGTKEARNTLVHVRNMPEEDYQRVADNDIVVVCGILWHVLADEMKELVKTLAPANVADKSYPMKSYFDCGAIMTSHSDYPATFGSPNDPFGIMEIAVTGSCQYPGNPDRYTSPWWPEELITIDQVFSALTINGAYQMHVENERGSIKVGKWADFVLTDQDVFECPVRDIHKTKVLSTWFEGKKVYEKQ